MSREQHIARTFVELADTLVEEFDVIDFLQQMTVRCRELLDVTDAAVFLAHPGPHLHSPAPCDPTPALQQLLEAACVQGPAVESHRTARTVTAPDASEAADRWPEFAARHRAAGYTLAIALPMRLRRENVGSLLLLSTGSRPLRADDLALAQALADATTIGLLQARVIREQHTVNEQLHTALQTRIVIEQAKGVLAVRSDITLNEAFNLMRRRARHHRLLLNEVARDVIENGLTPAEPAAPQGGPAEAATETE
ncbi:ANTAR domain-containing protein [Streptomyces sp. NPDC049813]|uniref:ANTAR domain-containing protein n=1 Tax=Streptomyces sp. NPDC049813 TaxID=3365597 RepID=UPI003789FF0B